MVWKDNPSDLLSQATSPCTGQASVSVEIRSVRLRCNLSRYDKVVNGRGRLLKVREKTPS